MIPAFSKNRSKRLRKKLRLSEFQNLGFDFKLIKGSAEAYEKFTDDLIEYVDSRGLSLFSCGGPDKMYVHISGSSCQGCRFIHEPGREPTDLDIANISIMIASAESAKAFKLEVFGKMHDINYEEGIQ